MKCLLDLRLRVVVAALALWLTSLPISQAAAAASAAAEPSATLMIVGDVMLGRGVARQMARYSADYPLRDVWPLLQAADLTVGNLECTISERGQARPGPYRLRAQPGAAGALARAGFDLLSLANNHAGDFGEEAFLDTLDYLKGEGIATLGAGRSAEEARKPAVRVVRGIKIAFLAYDTLGGEWLPPQRAAVARLDLPRLSDEIRQAKSRSDVLVVSFHWGDEYSRIPSARQRQVAQIAAQAGADLVIGHHPHVFQGVSLVEGAPVAYSLGNFVFDQDFNPDAGQGLAVQVAIDRRGVRSLRAVPVKIRLGRASPAPPADEKQMLDLLAKLSSPALEWTYDLRWQAGDYALAPKLTWQRPESAPAEQWEDLDGDGWPERLGRAADGRLILQQRRGPLWLRAWESDRRWQVGQALLADVDGDGRLELAFTMWRLDERGRAGNHLFIYRWQRGALRKAWCGSALADPIRHFTVKDLDDDGQPELIVLEGSYGEAADTPAHYVTIWRWNGFGFINEWRSEPGRYGEVKVS